MNQKEKARFVRWVAATHPDWADSDKHDAELQAASEAWHARAQYAERITRNKDRRRMENIK